MTFSQLALNMKLAPLPLLLVCVPLISAFPGYMKTSDFLHSMSPDMREIIEAVEKVEKVDGAFTDLEREANFADVASKAAASMCKTEKCCKDTDLAGGIDSVCNQKFLKNWRAEYDDPTGKPLSSLNACPVLNAMYNDGLIKPLIPLAEAAEEEVLSCKSNEDWDKEGCKNHRALLNQHISQDELRDAMIGVRFEDAVVNLVLNNVRDPIHIFQMHDNEHKHGQATRTRYNWETATGQYSQIRFDKWWAAVDSDDNDGYVNDVTVQNIFSMMENDSRIRAVNYGSKVPFWMFDWIKKWLVFVDLFLAFHDGPSDSELGKVPKSVYEEFFIGHWPSSCSNCKGKEFPNFVTKQKLITETAMRITKVKPVAQTITRAITFVSDKVVDSVTSVVTFVSDAWESFWTGAKPAEVEENDVIDEAHVERDRN